MCKPLVWHSELVVQESLSTTVHKVLKALDLSYRVTPFSTASGDKLTFTVQDVPPSEVENLRELIAAEV